ncbi:YcbX family protein, partial [Gilliamella sp. Fer4-1]|uniref:YcbX family protein n=1 Tax=Gilliamella sp. Fer4-1 TaxID=3120242 RepID=UPI001C40070D
MLNFMIAVNQLFIYPIKSMQGIALANAKCVHGGFEHDRILMLSEPDGTFITARRYPELLKVKTTIIDNQIEASLPTNESIAINFDEFSQSNEATEVWGNHFTSHIAPIKVNQFFSHFLQKDVQLRWIGKQLNRRTKRYPDVPVSFADGYPYLLLNQASFNYLERHCPEKLDIRQFRGNIVIDGALPFAEDGWKTIKIGEVIFDIVKPCTRCVLTTFNVNAAKALHNNEPLTTLAHFRSDSEGDIDFGMNMIARNSGTVSIGDKIEILERQTAKNYLKNLPKKAQKDIQPCTITYKNQKIIGNNQQTILEQLEQQHIALPNSCRAGVCGRCLVVLEKGEVEALTSSAIKKNKQILACSCIPKGDIAIEFK